MNLQLKIILGIVIWLAGVICDIMLLPYLFVFIYIGAVWTFFEVGKWLRSKANRQRVKQTFPFVRGGDRNPELIEVLFDFRWHRVSVLWTGVCVNGMILVFLASLMIKPHGAYETAIKSIEEDEEVARRTGGIIHFSSVVTGNTSTVGISNLYIGIVGRNESFWIRATVEATGDRYETTGLEIK